MTKEEIKAEIKILRQWVRSICWRCADLNDKKLRMGHYSHYVPNGWWFGCNADNLNKRIDSRLKKIKIL